MTSKLSLLLIALATAGGLRAQTGPEITSWIRNTTGATGYGGIASNVQLVQYDATDVYISATCIPGYSIGPWMSPNVPANMNFVYKVTRNPAPNTGTPTTVGLGHVGVWTNGVSVFNTQDANSYGSMGIWNQNAYYFEGSGFDNCLGHPSPTGEYHHHVSPKCLYDVTDSTHHSPIIGYAFDGYPIYGAYGYTDTSTASGTIKRMKSGFQLRSITQRHTLPDGTTLPSSEYGPDVSSTYALGAYQEDYAFTAGSGDLDVHNGRWCHTPEYPGGTYAYFVTIDASLTPQYPYTIGLTYYGIVQTGNTGPTGGHNTPPGGTTTYTGGTTGVAPASKVFDLQVFPNPATNYINLFIQPVASNNFTVTITDETGKTLFSQKNIQPAILYSFDISAIPNGVYQLSISNGILHHSEQVVIRK